MADKRRLESLIQPFCGIKAIRFIVARRPFVPDESNVGALSDAHAEKCSAENICCLSLAKEFSTTGVV